MNKKENKKDRSYPVFPTLRRMLVNVASQDKSLFLWFSLYTIASAMYPMFGVALPKYALEIITRPETAQASDLLITVGVLLAGTAVTGYFSNFLVNRTYVPIMRLRLNYLKDLYSKLIGMDYKYIEDSKFFDSHERAMEANNGNNNGVEAVYHALFESPSKFLTVLLLVALIGVKNVWILAALIINIAATLFISRKAHQYKHSRRSDIGHAHRKMSYFTTATQDFGYGKDIRVYSLKERIMEAFRMQIVGYADILKVVSHREFLLGFIGLFTLLVSDVAVYGLLTRDVLNGMSIADFSMYLTATASLSVIMKAFITQLSTVLNEGHYVHDFYAFIDMNLGEAGGSLPAVTGDTLEIEFDNVSFKYPNTDTYVIKNLSMKISKGERLAIVGVNGAGKTTIVKLMTGLFDVTEGVIRINGVPIKDYRRQDLFSMFSVVFQDVNVLAFTLLENIACNPAGDRARAEDALHRAGLGAKLDTLSKGLDQPMLKIIEEDGTEFSGGESQKLAIARALYKNANMVIMDEPTAALDALAEAEIYEHFSDLVEGKTAVYISHRLASTKFCDKIAFFDRDGLKEYGNHEELMSQKGDYYRMFTVQGKYYNQNQEKEGGAA